jgi:hypothetical protein
VTIRDRRKKAEIVDLSEVRNRLKLVSYQDKIGRVLESNRGAFTRLFNSGALFSRQGTKAGRDLLLAHQHLLKVVSLINQLTDLGEVPAPQKPREIDALYAELDLLLDRTSQLTSRTGEYLARLRGE